MIFSRFIEPKEAQKFIFIPFKVQYKTYTHKPPSSAASAKKNREFRETVCIQSQKRVVNIHNELMESMRYIGNMSWYYMEVLQYCEHVSEFVDEICCDAVPLRQLFHPRITVIWNDFPPVVHQFNFFSLLNVVLAFTLFCLCNWLWHFTLKCFAFTFEM